MVLGSGFGFFRFGGFNIGLRGFFRALRWVQKFLHDPEYLILYLGKYGIMEY